MTEKKPGEPDDPELAKRYAALDDYGKKLVHEIGALVLDAHAAGKREGAREALERAARVAERTVGGFTANVRVDESEQELVPDRDGPWVLNAVVAQAIRTLADQPEVEGKPNEACTCTYLRRSETSPAGVRRDPKCSIHGDKPLLRPPAKADAPWLEECDARNESFRKADALPLGHEFVPYDKNRGPCELCHECIPPNGFFCHKPEAAHGRKPE